MLGLHAAREQVGAQWAVGEDAAVERPPAGEHDVGLAEGLAVAESELGRGVLEGRQVVHDVVDERGRAQGGGHLEGHRRVQPDQVGRSPAEQVLDCGGVAGAGRVVEPSRAGRHLEPHAGDGPVVLGAQAGRGDVAGYGLLDEPRAPTGGQAGDEVLGSLPDEGPAQVGENDEVAWVTNSQWCSGSPVPPARGQVRGRLLFNRRRPSSTRFGGR